MAIGQSTSLDTMVIPRYPADDRLDIVLRFRLRSMARGAACPHSPFEMIIGSRDDGMDFGRPLDHQQPPVGDQEGKGIKGR